METKRIAPPPPIFKSVHVKDENAQQIEQLEGQISQLKEKSDQLREETRKKNALELAQAREEKFKLRAKLQEELSDISEANTLAGKLTPDAAMEFVKRKKDLAKQLEQVEKELGFRVIEDPKTETTKTFGLSSSKALWAIGALTLISFILFWLMGTAVIQDDPMNDSARRMMNSVGLRVLTNFLPFSAVFLTAIGFIWLLFPSVFAYWHNKVATNLSLITDLQQCEPYQRVGFFAFSFGLPVWAFVELMQVIFG